MVQNFAGHQRFFFKSLRFFGQFFHRKKNLLWNFVLKFRGTQTRLTSLLISFIIFFHRSQFKIFVHLISAGHYFQLTFLKACNMLPFAILFLGVGTFIPSSYLFNYFCSWGQGRSSLAKQKTTEKNHFRWWQWWQKRPSLLTIPKQPDRTSTLKTVTWHLPTYRH